MHCEMFIQKEYFAALIVFFGLTCTCTCEYEGNQKKNLQWDSNGYITFCLCMGRFGNQAEHFLGGLGFAKQINRTLIVPPFRTYKNVPFDEWFDVEALNSYHRVILMEDFLKDLAPKFWPQKERKGFCYAPSKAKCDMKDGNPFGPFWNELNIDFAEEVPMKVSYQSPHLWAEKYPASKYPVIALKGAPASFPIKEHHVDLHQYLKWSENIQMEAEGHLNQLIGHSVPYIGIHLRNGNDWERACQTVHHLSEKDNLMASPQCLGYRHEHGLLSQELCFPPENEIIRLLRKIVTETKINQIYVATDKNPMTSKIENRLQDLKVKVHHLDPWLPLIDLYILGRSNHFIGNCVSSFSAFVARERKFNKRPTYFWIFS